jgi:hypothetical protein
MASVSRESLFVVQTGTKLPPHFTVRSVSEYLLTTWRQGSQDELDEPRTDCVVATVRQGTSIPAHPDFLTAEPSAMRLMSKLGAPPT